MSDRIELLERLLTRRNAYITIAVLFVLTVFFSFSLRNIRLDHDFEKFFPVDDPELDRYNAFRERFGNDNDLLLIAASNEPSIFEERFLVGMDSLAAAVQQHPDVLSALAPTRIQEQRITPVGFFQVPWIRIDQPDMFPIDSARIWHDGTLIGSFISEDGKALLILVQTLPGLSKVRSDKLLADVDAAIEKSGITGVKVAGRVHGQYWYIEKMKHEMLLFFSLSVILLAIFLAIGARTVWGVLVPIGVVGLTVLWQVALITLIGKPLTILTMLLPTILFVVGMSDVVHIMERYIGALRNGHTKSRALAIAYYEIGLATFLTSLTTAIGFATLVTSGIVPIKEFGLYTAMGVVLAFILAFTFLPAVLILAPIPAQADRPERSGIWYPLLHSLFSKVIRQRRRIPIVFGSIILLCGTLMLQLKVDNQLLEDWAEDDPQKQAYYWFEEHFGGARPFELEITVKDTAATIWDEQILADLVELQDHLESEHRIRAINSPVTVLRSVNKAFNGGDPEFNAIPEDQLEIDRLVRRMNSLPIGKMLRTIVSPDGRNARISGRMKDEGGYIHRQRNAELDRFIAGKIDTDRIAIAQTGMAYLIDRNNEHLSDQLIGGLSIALLLIALIMGMVFRNWRMTLIALITNFIPLVFIAGFMAIAGIDIKVSTAIIFTIAFGIAVDDTIHLLGKLRIELAKGKSLHYAMKRSYLSTGKALITTSLMLFAGFISLLFSDLASVYYMGLLVTLTLFMALISDLVLLPVLLLKWLPSTFTARNER